MMTWKLLSIFLFFLEIRSSTQSADVTYNGGIPLRTPDECPAGSVTGQITFEQNCCGSGQIFNKLSSGSFCCPDENNCLSDIIAEPKCADPSWQLCGSNSDTGFCCQENWICYTQLPMSGNGGGVGCSTPGATLGLSQSQVSTIYAANAGPGVITTTSILPTSSSNSPSSAAATPSSTTSSPSSTGSSDSSDSSGSTSSNPPILSTSTSGSLVPSQTTSLIGSNPLSSANPTSSGSSTIPKVGSETKTTSLSLQTSTTDTKSNPPATSQSGSSSMASPGSKIGIGIGIAIGIAIIAAILGVLIFWRRRRNAARELDATYEADSGIKYELGNTGLVEMQDTGRHELGEGKPSEYDYRDDMAKSGYYYQNDVKRPEPERYEMPG